MDPIAGMPEHVLRQRVQSAGKCSETDDDAFVAEALCMGGRGARAAAELRARTLCAGCPVQAECLELELRRPVSLVGWGTWGGLASHERLALARQRAAERRAARRMGQVA